MCFLWVSLLLGDFSAYNHLSLLKTNYSTWILQVDAVEDEPKSFIYLSEDAMTNPDKLLVLVQGSGVVRAGQWARRLIINEDLDSGTQIPFINKAMKVQSDWV